MTTTLCEKIKCPNIKINKVTGIRSCHHSSIYIIKGLHRDYLMDALTFHGPNSQMNLSLKKLCPHYKTFVKYVHVINKLEKI